MRGNELLDKMEGINPAYIEEAGNASRKKKNAWIKWAAPVAACLCLAVVGALFLQRNTKSENEGPYIVLTEDGVTIPQMEVSLSKSEASMADMIAFFIYNGHCYVQYKWLEDADIVGEYLGTATGLIDEWTPKEGYVDFAGSVQGDFFAVKGYDPSFMLCMKYATGEVLTYICDNGITLKYGAELYEDRLHLSGNYSAVQYETRESWNFSKQEFYHISGNDMVVSSFVEQLDKAEFMPWDDVPKKEDMTASSIYDTEIYHVYFKMNNGTDIHLRLYRNGYVRFQGLLDICVQIPEDTFQSFVDMLDHRTDAEAVAPVSMLETQLEKCKADPELGAYVPTYEVPESILLVGEVIYYIEPQTAMETGTKEIYIEYTSVADPNLYYSVTVTWKDEYGKNGWAGPMLDSSELNTEALAEYVTVRESTGVPKIDVGVWYGDVSVVLSTSGIDAEEAMKIYDSVK